MSLSFIVGTCDGTFCKPFSGSAVGLQLYMVLVSGTYQVRGSSLNASELVDGGNVFRIGRSKHIKANPELQLERSILHLLGASGTCRIAPCRSITALSSSFSSTYGMTRGTSSIGGALRVFCKTPRALCSFVTERGVSKAKRYQRHRD